MLHLVEKGLLVTLAWGYFCSFEEMGDNTYVFGK